ncbi:MAG: phosphodiester glycosidase family protein, partial [Tissierellia bacterium]|nr:phosphodiester glycosidase family protein [Tissierellia bacterium]
MVKTLNLWQSFMSSDILKMLKERNDKMIFKKLKKIAAFSVAAVLLLTSTAYGSLYTVYDLKDEVRLSKGIRYERIEKYTSSGWMNLNLIRADLTDNYTGVAPINNENGVSKRATLSSMIRSSGAVAAVNGDFFYMGDPTYTYGPLIRNHKLITSPLPYSDGYPTVSGLVDGSVDISVWNPKISLYGSDSTEFNVIVLNKTSSIDWGPTILTTDWNKTSPGYTTKDIVEIVVTDNIVSEVRKNQPPVKIPENGYLIVSSNATTMENMLNSFKEGHPVSLNIELDFSPEEVNWSFGALNYLVKDGMVNEISSQVLGSHPRTAIGFNKDNTEMILLTIDGRHREYVGVKQTELAQIMIDLGAYNAVNMDGGGSTTMGVDFLRNANISVVNLPSDGRERNIASGVGVFDNSPESNRVDKIHIAASQDTIFNNTETELELKFYNEYYAPLDIALDQVKFEVSPAGAGKVVNNLFIPEQPGKATITAYVGNGEGHIEIDVLDKAVALKVSTDSITLGLNSTYELGDVLGIDKDGNSALIPWKYLNFSYRNRVGKIEEGIFTSGDTANTGAVTISFDDAVKNILVKVGYRYKTLDRFENLDNLKLRLYPEESNGQISIRKDLVKEGHHALKLDYDFTKMTDQSIAFIEFGEDGEGIKLEDKPLAIGMWVYGDGKDHWLRTRVYDVYGKEVRIDFAEEVNWTGWKWVEAKIPEGIAYPIRLKNIYLAEINETKKDAGTIYIDNLRVMYEPMDKQLGLREETKFVDPLKTSKIADYIEKLTISQGEYDYEGSGEIVYCEGIISNGSMSASNTTMWNNIKSLSSYQDKVLVLSMNASIDNIKDEREVRILKEILENASVNNDVFLVFEGESENTIIENRVRYISYTENF